MTKKQERHKRNRSEKENFIKRWLPKNKTYLIIIIIMGIVADCFLAMLTILNMLPISVTLTIIGIMLLLLFMFAFLIQNKARWIRNCSIAISILFVIAYGMGTNYLVSTYATFNEISNSTGDTKEINVDEEPFNIYITGIDQWESEKGKDLERSDVNMIVSVSPAQKKILLTSIPRDSYVALHRNGAMDKLTHTGIYGVEETLNTVEDWLGLDMNYYLKMNFSGVVDIINAMGGIEVYSPKSFVPVKRSWWTVQKGWQHMSGKEALAFARERKAFAGKDSERVKNQQNVVKAIIKKMTSSSTLLLQYNDILGAAGENMETNMNNKEMQKLVKMQLSYLGDWDVETQSITGKYAMDYVASLTQEKQFLVYKTDKKSTQKCVANIEKVLEK